MTNWASMWKGVTLENTFNDQAFTLLCPLCLHNYMHQMDVEVFARRIEDAEDGAHVIVKSDATVLVNSKMDGNPSGRRDGIRIRFTCEECHFEYEGIEPKDPIFLCIVQHKGETHVYCERDVGLEG